MHETRPLLLPGFHLPTFASQAAIQRPSSFAEGRARLRQHSIQPSLMCVLASSSLLNALITIQQRLIQQAKVHSAIQIYPWAFFSQVLDGLMEAARKSGVRSSIRCRTDRYPAFCLNVSLIAKARQKWDITTARLLSHTSQATRIAYPRQVPAPYRTRRGCR